MAEHRHLVRARRKAQLLARLFPYFERAGIHVTLNDFYEPVPELSSLPLATFSPKAELPGVDMRDEEQLQLLRRMREFRSEYTGFRENGPVGSPPTYYRRNEQFERVDAEVLHSMIRIHRPRRIIEIGAGYSTLVATAAIELNRADDPAYACEVLCVEPYPRGFLPDVPSITLVEEKVQDLPLEFFSRLEDGDFLFVDSSHVLKIGSDVQFEFLEVIPRVASGVHVQVHDIFFPSDYPRVFVMDWHRFFTEQYLLQAFLAFNSRFHVTWSGSWMARFHEADLTEAFPAFAKGGMWPSSFWMRRAGGANAAKA